MDAEQKCFQFPGHILLLSDEVLLMILRRLSSRDLFNIFRACRRFRNICQETELWRNIDTPPDDYEALDLVFNRFFNRQTFSLRIESRSHGENSAFKSSFASSHISQICPTIRLNPLDISLTHLYIIRQKFDRKLLDLSHLPSTLKVLHLTGTVISNVSESSFYFKDVWRSLPKLEDLDLTDCTWVPAHSLMGLSKFPLLRRLSLRGCREIGNCLAYSSIAFRFGFKTLKVLDVTNTYFRTGEFYAIALVENLEEFYFGEYDMEEDSNAIQDASLHALRSLNSLRVLDLSGHNITDAGLDVLLSLPTLERIDAHFTAITTGAMERFTLLKPDCTINKNMSYFDIHVQRVCLPDTDC